MRGMNAGDRTNIDEVHIMSGGMYHRPERQLISDLSMELDPRQLSSILLPIMIVVVKVKYPDILIGWE